MNRFFLKIHADERHCSGGFGFSRNKADWEGRAIKLPNRGPVLARKEDNKTKQKISSGDELWIWTHETSGGHGLIAKATAVCDPSATRTVVLQDVEIVPKPFDYRVFPERPKPLNGRVTGSRFLDYTSMQRPSAVYLLEGEDHEDFLAVVRERGWAGEVLSQPDGYWENEVQNHKADLLEGLENRKTASINARSGQGPFRRDLMKRHNRKCVITKCPVPEALEAAHVMRSTGDPKWDHPDNGLLLRRDLHALFDELLWSIDPDTNQLRIAEKLKRSIYRKLEGREINHQVAPVLLAVHFERFNNRGQDD